VEALNKFRVGSYDLILLDLMLPKMDGWTVCREIRKTSKVPVIMLTARGEEYDKLFGFELGVDDYVVKPFSPKELMARMKAVLNRSIKTPEKVEKENKIQLEDLIIDFDGRTVFLNNEIIALTPKEYDLLSFFVQNQNKVFSRDQLLTSVWGYDFSGDDRTVDTHIKMLRESLKKYRKWIVTVWGVGYKFETRAES
jgi:DNA-binding response OmpR family regulator